jgi:L-histidine N-alpha-methyltransferase
MSALVLATPVTTEFAQDVLTGLARPGQKELPSRWLYDELGSVLFDAITLLPEYGLTRADARVLKAHAGSIAKAMPGDVAIVELGSGSGTKTRWILEAFARHRPVDYFPIDISPTALEKCRGALENISGVRIVELATSYLDGLKQAAAGRNPKQKILVLFLGSTIGNFDYRAARQFLRQIRDTLAPGDALLLGADLVKPLPQMIPAYDDAMGVTAAFNLNVLARMNRELAADFDLRRFQHHACFNHEESRIEMHLRALTRHSANVVAIDREIRFEAGETIWTEGSYKFRRQEIIDMGYTAGFEPRAQWVDGEWPFSETLMFARP